MPETAGIYYDLYGPADAPPLILSAGLGGSGAYWAPNIPALAEKFRVITYDHRGTGRSEPLAGATSIEAMSADVIGLMDTLGVGETRFVGHALGGLIGIETAIMTTRISHLVVINAWRSLDPHTGRCFDVRLDLLRDSGPAAYLRAQPLFLYPPDWISTHDRQLREEAERQLAHFPGAATIEARIAALRAYDPKLIDLNATAHWLVIATRDDLLVPAVAARDVAAPIAWAECVTLDWGGHACNVTDPDTFNRLVLDFLGE